MFGQRISDPRYVAQVADLRRHAPVLTSETRIEEYSVVEEFTPLQQNLWQKMFGQRISDTALRSSGR